MAEYLEIQDSEGRNVRVPVHNTEPDGSGEWYIPVVSEDGILQVALPAITGVIGLRDLNSTMEELLAEVRKLRELSESTLGYRAKGARR